MLFFSNKIKAIKQKRTQGQLLARQGRLALNLLTLNGKKYLRAHPVQTAGLGMLALFATLRLNKSSRLAALKQASLVAAPLVKDLSRNTQQTSAPNNH